jgi:hypothetical protein
MTASTVFLQERCDLMRKIVGAPLGATLGGNARNQRAQKGEGG